MTSLPGLAAITGLPVFPWDQLVPYLAQAAEYPDGAIDLSMGTPVDATPGHIRRALARASDAPGYPLAAGTTPLRAAFVDWAHRRLGATLTSAHVLPCLGSKELVSLLPFLLGLRGKQILIPELAYPTYEVGALLAGCEPVAASDPLNVDPAQVGLVWLNSPSNPTGRVQSADELGRIVKWARAHAILVASDECYLDFGWDADPVSVLHPSVSGGDPQGLLALNSLSKRSNLAGYRSGFVLGDEHAVAILLEARKHLGLLPPAPVQAATIAALQDDSHVAIQRALYRDRRRLLRDSVERAGFAVQHSEAGLYLWCTRDEDCWQTVSWLAERGIVGAPGSFYGDAGRRHVRLALTASDEHIRQAVDRLNS